MKFNSVVFKNIKITKFKSFVREKKIFNEWGLTENSTLLEDIRCMSTTNSVFSWYLHLLKYLSVYFIGRNPLGFI